MAAHSPFTLGKHVLEMSVASAETFYSYREAGTEDAATWTRAESWQRRGITPRTCAGRSGRRDPKPVVSRTELLLSVWASMVGRKRLIRAWQWIRQSGHPMPECADIWPLPLRRYVCLQSWPEQGRRKRRWVGYKHFRSWDQPTSFPVMFVLPSARIARRVGLEDWATRESLSIVIATMALVD